MRTGKTEQRDKGMEIRKVNRDREDKADGGEGKKHNVRQTPLTEPRQSPEPHNSVGRLVLRQRQPDGHEGQAARAECSLQGSPAPERHVHNQKRNGQTTTAFTLTNMPSQCNDGRTTTDCTQALLPDIWPLQRQTALHPSPVA